MSSYLEYWEILARLSLATFTGAVLGWEREYRDKSAGLRTHMMVSLGAAVFMLIGIEFAYGSGESDVLTIDPLRVVQGIVGGVGFLGAGSIIQAGTSVRGLTTAASIWLVAAAGVACGGGMYAIAGTGAVLGVVILTVVGIVENRVQSRLRTLRSENRVEDNATTD